MRRMVLFAVAALIATALVAPSASAGEPNATHATIDIDETWSSKKVCDFTYVQHFWGWFGVTVVGDPDDPDLEVFAGGQLFVTHTNASTGFTLSEQVMYTDVYLHETERILEAGLYWHLRGPDGSLVLVQAGLVTYDFDYEVLSYTPNRSLLHLVASAQVCELLGDAPR